MSVDLYLTFKSKKDGAQMAPPDLHARLVADATEQGTNANAVAVAILCRAFNVPVDEADGRRSRRAPAPAAREDGMMLTVPPQLRLELDIAASQRKLQEGRNVTANQEAVYALSAHYGLRVPAPPVRARRRRRTTRAAA